MMQPAATLALRLPPAFADHFSLLFSAGVGVKTTAGISLTDLLCRQLGIAPEYVDQRIQTIFLNHRAVDRAEQVLVPADAVLALSAAMPGLVGATFRKGGFLSGFRKDISYQNGGPKGESRQDTMITLKLFNLVAEELGPYLLTQGVWVQGRILAQLLLQAAASSGMSVDTCCWNGRIIPAAELPGLDWPDWVAFSVTWDA